MNIEELKTHCKRQIDVAEDLHCYNKHYYEHSLILNIINDNEKLNNQLNLLKQLTKELNTDKISLSHYKLCLDNIFNSFNTKICCYCTKVNGDDVEETNYSDYYSCQYLNNKDIAEYEHYDSLENQVIPDDCKYYLCTTCKLNKESS